MFNPFEPYAAKYLPAFKKKGVIVFVLQTYERGRNQLDDTAKPAYLLTHYNDMKMAVNHMDAIEHDPDRRLLNIHHDYDELLAMGQPDAPVTVFLNFKIPDAEIKAKRVLDKKIRAYIDWKLQWRVPGGQTVAFSLESIFGEIYAVLRYGGRYHKTKIEDIETTSGYVL